MVTHSETWRDLIYNGHVSSFSEQNTSHGKSFSNDGESPLQSVFEAYGLQPKEVMKVGKVWRVEDQKGAFALKQGQLSEAELDRLLFFQQALHQGPIRTPAIIPTQIGEPFFKIAEGIYYLTPWILESDREKTDQEEILWDTLAEWHRTTVKTCQVGASWVEAFSERCLEVWSEQVLTLDQFMNDCEHRIYPSPFEQRFLAFYRDIRSGAEEGYRTMKAFQETLEKKDQVRLVYCHGKPRVDHLIVSGQQRNWVSTEASGFDFPVRDLSWLLRWGVDDDLNPDSLMRYFDIYEMTFPLENHEKQLLLAQMSHPSKLVYLINRYQRQRGNYLEAEQTIMLETAFHQWGKTWQTLTKKLEENKEFSSNESENNKD